jgi:membrane-bound serine protease (ClpP class)
MALLIAIVLAAIFLPWPWALLAILGGLVVETGEVALGLTLARRWKPKTGEEAMIGRIAEVVTPCLPVGEVRVAGELWQARCEAGADVGDRVRIMSIEELTLTVTPEPPRAVTASRHPTNSG